MNHFIFSTSMWLANAVPGIPSGHVIPVRDVTICWPNFQQQILRVSQDPMLCNEKGLLFAWSLSKPLTFWCSQWTQWVWVEEKNMTSKDIILKGSLGSEYRLFQVGKSLRLFFLDWVYTVHHWEFYTAPEKDAITKESHFATSIHSSASCYCLQA